MKAKICGFNKTSWNSWSSAWLDRHVSSHVKMEWRDAHSSDSWHRRVTSQMTDIAGVRLVMADMAEVYSGGGGGGWTPRKETVNVHKSCGQGWIHVRTGWRGWSYLDQSGVVDRCSWSYLDQTGVTDRCGWSYLDQTGVTDRCGWSYLDQTGVTNRCGWSYLDQTGVIDWCGWSCLDQTGVVDRCDWSYLDQTGVTDRRGWLCLDQTGVTDRCGWNWITESC